MKYNVIVDSFNNRAVAFCNDKLEIPDTYLVLDVEHDGTIIGKKYNNGTWEEVSTPISEENKYKSAYALGLNKI